MGDFRNLIFYQKAYENAMKIFEISKTFPQEEKYALTSQIRRSSRSVCANIAEGYRKRRYSNHFISKMSDADMENSETIVWIDFTLSCKYTTEDQHAEFIASLEDVSRLLNYAMKNPGKFR